MLSSSNTITKVTARKLLLRKNWKLSLSSHPSPSLSARSHNNNNIFFSTSAPITNNAHPHSTTDNDATATSKPGTNSNPSEVDKFSSFAGHWWDSRANPLVGMNPIRIRFMREVLLARQPQQPQQPHPKNDHPTPISPSSLPPLHGKRVLDIGCGGGLLTESMARLGASTVVGVDASSHVVEVAKRRHSFSRRRGLGSCDDGSDGDDADKVENGIRYFGGRTVEELADDWHSHRRRRLSEDPSSNSNNSNNSNNNNEYELFDVITALEIIEHVPDPTSLLRSAVSLLRPDGILFVSTINRTWKSYGMAIVAAEYISGKVPIGTHDWNRFWSPDEVERMVCRVERDGSDSDSGRVIDGGCEETRYAMKQVGLSGMVVQPPFVNLKWSLDPLDTDVNWIGAYQKQRVR